MEQNIKDRLIFLGSGLLIGLGLAAFFFNLKTIQVARAHDPQPSVPESSAQRADKNPTQSMLTHSFFKDRWTGRDLFQEMESLQKRLWQGWTADSLFADSPWPAGMSSGEQNLRVEQRETADYLIYEISLASANEGSQFDVSVENQMVTVRGRQVSQSKDSTQAAFYSSSQFSQSFSVPPGLDSENVQMENRGQRVILKFPKRPSSEV